MKLSESQVRRLEKEAYRRTLGLWRAVKKDDDSYYELWFAYLRAAHQSECTDIRDALQRSLATRYKEWPDVREIDDKKWLRKNLYRFGMDPCTHVVWPGKQAIEGEITIAIQLRHSEARIISDVNALVEHMLITLRRIGDYAPPTETRHLDALRDYLIVHDVEKAARATNQAGSDLVAIVRREYSKQRAIYPLLKPSRKRETGHPLWKDDRRAARQYITDCVHRANQIIKNVANGIQRFPGKYI